MLKKQQLDPKSEEIMSLGLKDLQNVLQCPSANFENVLMCLSFTARSHLQILKKGQEEGTAWWFGASWH